MTTDTTDTTDEQAGQQGQEIKTVMCGQLKPGEEWSQEREDQVKASFWFGIPEHVTAAKQEEQKRAEGEKGE